MTKSKHPDVTTKNPTVYMIEFNLTQNMKSE